jgi:hypothetical protein
MNDETQAALQKAAEYVQATEPVLEAYETKQASFNQQVDRTAAVLINRGVLIENKREDFVTKCAEDPRFALQFMEKMAAAIGTADLGGPSDVKVAEDGTTDPFEKEFFPERFQYQTGMIN